MRRLFLTILMFGALASAKAQEAKPFNFEKTPSQVCFETVDDSYLMADWRKHAFDAMVGSSITDSALVAEGVRYLDNRFSVAVNKFWVAYSYGSMEQMMIQKKAVNAALDQIGRLLATSRISSRISPASVKNVQKQWNALFKEAMVLAKSGKSADELTLKAMAGVSPMDYRTKGNALKRSWKVISNEQPLDGIALLEHTNKVFTDCTFQDIYKSAFQDEFGPAHLITDLQSCIDYINKELEYVTPQENLPFIDVTGAKGNYFRVNLQLVKDGVITAEKLAECVMKSAEQPNEEQLKGWRMRWEMMVAEMPTQTLKNNVNQYEVDKVNIGNLLAQGKYVMHHSEQFNKTYNYHYRIVRSDIFLKEIWPSIVANQNKGK